MFPSIIEYLKRCRKKTTCSTTQLYFVKELHLQQKNNILMLLHLLTS